MEHNYIEYLKDMRNDAIDEILTYANGDVEYYFEEKAEALADEDGAEWFKENTCCTPSVSCQGASLRDSSFDIRLIRVCTFRRRGEFALKSRRNKIWNLNYHSRTGTLNA